MECYGDHKGNIITRIDPAHYLEAYREFALKHPNRAWCVSDLSGSRPPPTFDFYILEGYLTRFYIAEGNALTLHLGGVFSDRPGLGSAKVLIRALTLAHPDRSIVLDCYDCVRPVWESLGFREYMRNPWMQQYAPKNWKPEFGTPDVVYMSKAPEKEFVWRN